MDWEDLRHFLALAQNGTFLGAARQIGVEHATISRRIVSLEQSLGLKLIDRRGRRIVLTAEGEDIANRGAIIVEQFAALEQASRHPPTALRGHVRISAPPTLAAVMLAEPIVCIRKRYPGILITLIGETRFASLTQREADVAIRLSRPESGNYSIVKLGMLRFHLYATKSYLETVPASDWTFIGYDEGMAGAPQHIRLVEYAGSRPITIRSSILEMQASAARLDGGIATLPDFMVTKADGLVKIEQDALLMREIWLVVHSEMKDAPTIHAVIDALKLVFHEANTSTSLRT